MSNRPFFVSDHHLQHSNILVFTESDGSRTRPEWDKVEEMNEALIENHNSVVGPKDKVYFLGDVVINRKGLPLLSRMNGDKVLIKGNHDIFRAQEYLEYFRDIRGSHKLGNFILSHIPIHPASISRWAGGNIHGHLHRHSVKLPDGNIDPRYLCVSVEQINYTPISLDEIEAIMNKRKDDIERLRSEQDARQNTDSKHD